MGQALVKSFSTTILKEVLIYPFEEQWHENTLFPCKKVMIWRTRDPILAVCLQDQYYQTKSHTIENVIGWLFWKSKGRYDFVFIV